MNPISRSREVLPEAARLLGQIRAHGNPADVDDPESGLRFQFECELIDVTDLEEILHDRIKMENLVERGIFRS